MPHWLFLLWSTLIHFQSVHSSRLKHGQQLFLWPENTSQFLKVYLPDKFHENRTTPFPAFIVNPGGGYRYLSSKESVPPAEWLNEQGIISFVFHYALGPRHIVPEQFNGMKRAMKLIRFHSSSWNVDRFRIGVLGFSAGGHLASWISTHFDSFSPWNDPIDTESARPNLQILIYPVIDFTTTYGPCSAVLGDAPNPSQKMLKKLSTHLHVKINTPPAFISHTWTDQLVNISNSIQYVQALESLRIPVQFVQGDWGGHGFGMNSHWLIPCKKWIRKMWFSPLVQQKKNFE